ncbi:MAG: hypothetical protein OEV44_07680 [Spirochaetota bacterium]|nr:hypothetical protein [Spirochaetota bacterium]
MYKTSIRLMLILLTLSIIGFACNNKTNSTNKAEEKGHSHDKNPTKATEEKSHSHGTTDHAKETLNQKTKNTELTLIEIMRDLAFQVSRIEFGILTNNRYMIAEGSSSIANHPMPKGGIKPYLRKNIEMVKSKIPEMDKNIHQTAKEMIIKSKTAPMRELQEMNNKIMSGCVSCHHLFRD